MQILYTKNPKTHGNAIIVTEYDPTANTLINYLNGRKMWIVETDFGNRMVLTDDEIDERFDRGDLRDYEDWADAKRHLLNRTWAHHAPSIPKETD